jgi:Ca-activated chloride channel family protein
MAADDMEPTRMEAAKEAGRAFVDRQPASVEIGVASFSEGGFTVQIPTNDQAAILAAIDRLTPQRSTSLGSGILVALNAIAVHHAPPPLQYSDLTPQPTPLPTPMPRGQYAPAVIVLLTDGENTADPDPLAAAQTAADRGVRIYTVGIGSAGGSDLTIEGFIVHTQLDEVMLQQIAAISGGSYYNAESSEELRVIYDNLVPEFVIKPEKMEVTSLFAGAGILSLLMGGMISLVWFGRVP